MGNAISEQKKKPLTIHGLKVKVGEYKTIQEGDPEMKEDPDFPTHMLHEAMNTNNTIEGDTVKGTYVYYPNKNKPKMWIGNYKILNPEDILCKDIAAKIGMSEAQWQKYIEYKQNGKSMSECYEEFDFLTDEQKERLKNVMNSGANKNPYNQYNNENELNKSGFNSNELKTDRFNEQRFEEDANRNHILYQEYIRNQQNENMDKSYDQINPEMEKDFLEYNKNMYEQNVDGEIVNDHAGYIEKLNKEASRIRQTQEDEIYKQQRDLMQYCNMNIGHGTEVSPMPNNIIPQNISSPFKILKDEDIQYLEEDELAEINENLYLTNYKNKLQKSEKYEEDEEEEEEYEEEEKKKEKVKRKKKEPIARKTQAHKTQQKKQGNTKEDSVKAKVNSYAKGSSINSRIETITKKNPSKSYKSFITENIKSSSNINRSKIITTDKNTNLKKTTLKKAFA